MKNCTRFLFVLMFLAVLSACSDAEPEATTAVADDAPGAVVTETDPAPPEAKATPVATAAPAAADPTPEPKPRPTLEPIEPVVFANDFGTSVAPIFASKCASCHNDGGPGSIHWKLETAGDLVATHEWISSIVDSKYMPPWPASDLSLVFHDDRSLRADQIEAIRQWSLAGAPLDVEPSAPIAAPDGVIKLDADIEIPPHESYQGSAETADDYRCFIYDPALEEPAWMQGYEFVPDQTQIVHHAIGYLAQAEAMQRAEELSNQDEAGGWQCYGGSRLGGAGDMFLGWAPGQLPTQYPDGSGAKMNPGDFIVVQIHYHYDTDAPADNSSIRLDWAEGDDLDQIDFASYVGPAEIPCSSDEEGPLCDRSAALARALSRYGPAGVLADGINLRCGVRPEDFADMTNGIASSSCRMPVDNRGEIISVLGHEHEIGKSFRLTLNPGTPDERILLDIPDWSFDWQFNYYPVESIMLGAGDSVLLECEWDRSRRDASLEPAYILWADGTNDEMCFATISTRRIDPDAPAVAQRTEAPDISGVELEIPDELAACMADAGVPIDDAPTRDEIDATIDQLYVCAEPDEIGSILSGLISDNFGGLIVEDGLVCLSEGLSNREAARSLLIFTLEDATPEERQPMGELVGTCVSLSSAMTEFGFELPESASECVDRAGRDLLVEAMVGGVLPDQQALLGVIGPCLTGG